MFCFQSTTNLISVLKNWTRNVCTVEIEVKKNRRIHDLKLRYKTYSFQMTYAREDAGHSWWKVIQHHANFGWTWYWLCIDGSWMLHKGLLDNFSVAGCFFFFNFQTFTVTFPSWKNTVLCFSGGKHVWNQLGELIMTWWSAGNLMSKGDLEYIRRSLPWSWDSSWWLFEACMLWEEQMIQTTAEPTIVARHPDKKPCKCRCDATGM